MTEHATLAPESEAGRRAITDLLSRALARPVVVEQVTALSGGASSATWALRFRAGDAPLRAIFQRSASAQHPGLSRATQAELLRRAAALGVPAPAVLAVPELADRLGDGMITAFVEGEALASRWLRDPAFARARHRLTDECAQALARLHAAPLSHWADLPLAGGSGAALLEEMFASYRRLAVDVPAFDLAFAWLRPRMPAHPATCLAHGDFRSGNLLVSTDGLAAVLDWEIAHLSVPEEDLGWLCVQAWRFGNWQRPVGGFGEREALVAAYRRAGGVVNEADLWTWEVYGNLRWGMSCLQLADDHVSGRVPSVERAAIGRRVSEVAADLVHAIERGTL